MPTNKYSLLALSILFDCFGMVSFTIPVVGEFSDVVWAPLSAYLLMKLYPTAVGRIAGVVNFVEEAFPVLDVIPTFTLTWLYTFVYKKEQLPENRN